MLDFNKGHGLQGTIDFWDEKEVVTVDNEAKSKEAIEKYREYLVSERNYSDFTINSYISDICEFKDFLTSFNFFSTCWI